MSQYVVKGLRVSCLSVAIVALACLGAVAQNVTVAQTTQNQTTSAFTVTPDMVQPILNLAPGSATGVNVVITVDNTTGGTYSSSTGTTIGGQQIDGFGSDFDDLTLNLMRNPALGVNGNTVPMTTAQQTAFLQSLFSPTTGYDPTAGGNQYGGGYGFNMMLITLGAGAEVYKSCWGNPEGNIQGCSSDPIPEATYDDNAGVVDNCLVNGGNQLLNFATPCNFTIAGSYHSDLTYQIPGIQQIMGLNPGMHVLGSNYFFPNWMMIPETNGCESAPLMGSPAVPEGLVTVAPTYYQTMANYYLKFVQSYENLGIPIWALIPLNEPCIPAAAQASDLTPAEAINLLKNYMVPTFQAASVGGNLTFNIPGTSTPKAYNTQFMPELDGYITTPTNYLQSLMQDPVLAPNLLGVAWHGYYGYPDVEVVGTDATITQTNGTIVHVDQQQTEYGGPASSQVAGSFDFRAFQPMAGFQQGLKSWMWNATANNDADNLGGCNGSGTGGCFPLMTLNTAGLQTQYQSSYIMKQYSRYIHPGAYIVNSSSSSSGEYPVVAARNPDGSTVLIVVNYDETDPTRTFGVNWGGRTFSFTLPLYSMATFLWPGIQNATNVEVNDATQGTGLNQLDYSGSWIHSASCGLYTGCYGATLSTDTVQGDIVTMSFQGSYVNVYGGVSPTGGTAVISIDGGVATAINEAEPTVYGNPAVFTMPAGNALLYSTPLYAPLTAGATHTLTITNTSSQPFVLDRVEVVTPTMTTVDDSAQGSGSYQFNYVGGGWTHCTSCTGKPYLGTSSSDSAVGDSVSFKYTGTAVTLYATTGPAQGYAMVTYDSNPPVKIDTYSNTVTGNQVAWVSPTPASGTVASTHTLTVSVVGSHAAYSNGNAVTIDRVELLSAATVGLSLNPSSVTLAAGGGGTSTLTLTPEGGFTGAVAITCSSPVAYINCSATTPVSITGTTPSTSTITVNVAATAELRLPQHGSTENRIALALLLPLGSLWLAFCYRHRNSSATRIRRGMGIPFLCLLAGCLMATLSGCAGKSTAATAAGPNLPPAGTQSIVITATTANGSASTILTVNVSN